MQRVRGPNAAILGRLSKQKKPHHKGKASPVPSCSPELDLTIGRPKDGKCRAVIPILNNKVRVLPMGHGSR